MIFFHFFITVPVLYFSNDEFYVEQTHRDEDCLKVLMRTVWKYCWVLYESTAEYCMKVLLSTVWKYWWILYESTDEYCLKVLMRSVWKYWWGLSCESVLEINGISDFSRAVQKKRSIVWLAITNHLTTFIRGALGVYIMRGVDICNSLSYVKDFIFQSTWAYVPSSSYFAYYIVYPSMQTILCTLHLR